MSSINSSALNSANRDKPRRQYALVDCDNFYVSCERVFAPALRRRPVAILSNNDGCIISRSAEVKALGIKLGAPLHHVSALIKRHNIAVLSSNYALYGDMSQRVITALRQFTPDVEVYSIDEAFVRLARGNKTFVALASQIRTTILRWTGIPVSIGLASTKTLAKVAVERAKTHRALAGVCELSALPDPTVALAELPVSKVWGIGRRHAKWLAERGVHSAADLRDFPDEQIRARAGIVGLRTVWELRGQSCLPLDMVIPPRKHIICSRSFGRPVRSYALLREAVACYATRAGAKLRRDKSVAGLLSVFVMTNRFSSQPQYSKSAQMSLTPASDSDADLVRAATSGLAEIYRPDFVFHKAGVTLSQITPAAETQLDAFAKCDFDRREKLNQALDTINRNHGPGAVRYAATGMRRLWLMRSERRSPRYTTRWEELPEAICRNTQRGGNRRQPNQ
ncbi:Y-family DNA polymerase [Gemmatimonas aurantiaca]|nr:Y-family DNA polymerase [Gemmatimonas aurantiaca]